MKGCCFTQHPVKWSRNTTQYHFYNLKIHTKMHSSPIFWLGRFLLQITETSSNWVNNRDSYCLTSSPEFRQLPGWFILWLSCQEPGYFYYSALLSRMFWLYPWSAFLIITGWLTGILGILSSHNNVHSESFKNKNFLILKNIFVFNVMLWKFSDQKA